MKRFIKTILPTLLSILLGVFIMTPLVLANEKAIENLTWFQKLTNMFELIYKSIDVIIALILIVGGILYYVVRLNKEKNTEIRFLQQKIEDQKTDLIKLIDINREDAHEISKMLNLATKRKINYLYKCIKLRKTFPVPKNWITKEESRLHKDGSKRRTEFIDKLNEKLDKNESD